MIEITESDQKKKRPSSFEREDFSSKYLENNPFFDYLIKSYFQSVNNLLATRKNKFQRTLEIGCGEGFSTALLRKLLSTETILEASDIVEHQIPIAIERNPNVKIIQETVYNLKREDHSFDLIFLLEVLEHLEYPSTALKEIARVSKKYLLLGVPREPLWRILNFGRGKYISAWGNTPGHLNHWSKKGIVNFVKQYFGPVVAVENPIPWTILIAKKSF